MGSYQSHALPIDNLLRKVGRIGLSLAACSIQTENRESLIGAEVKELVAEVQRRLTRVRLITRWLVASMPLRRNSFERSNHAENLIDALSLMLLKILIRVQ